MRIMVRGKGERGWKPLDASKYDGEAHLQELLDKDIDLIPLPNPLVACVREFGLPGSGSSDIIAVDGDGGITIIECKLAKSREVRRMVIGQLLEYAAFLTRMSADEFVETFDDLADAPLYQTMANELGEEFEESAFKDALTENLDQGEFTLIVAVDKINDELKEIILYLNAHSDCTVGALELEYFKDEKQELLVPRLYGGPEVKEATGRETSSRKTKKWNRELFLKDAHSNVDNVDEEMTIEYVHALEDLLDFSEENADEVVWGVGKDYGSFGFKVHTKTGKATIFYAYSDATIMVHFYSLCKTVPTTGIEKFRMMLNEIPGVELEKKDFEHYSPWIDTEFMLNKSTFDKFKRAVIWITDKIRSYEEK